jgi:3',5'-cyclic AMP phosphodiesterase CpdA
MKLAHFSDLHLCKEFGIKRQLRVVQRMLEDAVSRGVDHFVFTGDFVDYGNVKDFGRFCAMLKDSRIKSSHVTVLPGNHDIYPVRGSGHASMLFKFLPDLVTDVLMGRNAQKNFEHFCRLARPFTAPMEHLGPDGEFCYIRMLSKSAALVALDSTHSHWVGRFDPAAGHIDAEVMESISEAFTRHPYARAHTRILAMHHRPWSVRKPQCTNFDNLRQVQSFIKRNQFQAVLCGHIHEFHEKRIAGAIAFCSASHFAIDETEEDLGYTLVSIGRTIRGRVIPFDQ